MKKTVNKKRKIKYSRKRGGNNTAKKLIKIVLSNSNATLNQIQSAHNSSQVPVIPEKVGGYKKLEKRKYKKNKSKKN